MASRRAAIVAGVATLAAVGAAAWIALRVAHARRPPPPTLVVVVPATPGLSSEDAETGVLDPLEDAVSSVSHVTHLEGRATSDGVRLTITLDRGADLGLAQLEVQKTISASLTRLPPGTPPPAVVEAPVDGPRFVVRGDGTRSALELRRVLDDTIAPALETVPGVTRISGCGGREPAIEVVVDPSRLAAAGIDALGVARALRAQTLLLPSGATVTSASDVGAVAVTHGAARVFLRDVAKVSDDGRTPRCAAWGPDGALVVGSIGWIQGAPTPEKGVSDAIAKQASALPPGVRVAPFDFDGAVRLRAFVALDGAPSDAKIADDAVAIAKAARVANVDDAIVTTPRDPHGGVDLAVEATMPRRSSGAKIEEARRALARAIRQIPGVAAVVAATDDHPLVIARLLGTDLGALSRGATAVQDALGHANEILGVLPIDTRAQMHLEVRVDRARAADLGVPVRDVAETVALEVSGEEVGETVGPLSSREPIWLRVDGRIEEATIKHAGSALPLAMLVTAHETTEPGAIAHHDRERSVALWIDLAEPAGRKAAVAAAASAALPAGVRIVWE